MNQMKDFAFWFLDQLPAFLMSEPMCYFVGLFFLGFIVVIFRRIIGLK